MTGRTVIFENLLALCRIARKLADRLLIAGDAFFLAALRGVCQQFLCAGAEDDVPGVDEAAWVADLIEDTLVGARDGPLVLEDDVAEAVFYVLDSTIENPKGEAYRLYLALRALHHELEEL